MIKEPNFTNQDCNTYFKIMYNSKSYSQSALKAEIAKSTFYTVQYAATDLTAPTYTVFVITRRINFWTEVDLNSMPLQPKFHIRMSM